ncbi:MAG TPA: hypothetical protein VKY26_11485, partial [Actinomycetota bacterium]|nr:hypothetical protein [Actinomycetota bacterium]
MWVLSLECDRCRKRFDVLLSSDADEIAETVRLMDAEARAGEYSVTVTCRECGEEAADACVVAEEMIE